MIARAPCAALKPFVEKLWSRDDSTHSPDTHQLALPTGKAHLVIRLDQSPIRINGIPIGSSIIGGIRSTPYYKDIDPHAPSVGMLLRAGALELLSGAPASAFAHTHTDLETIWGSSALGEIVDRLCQTHSPLPRLRVIEDVLLQRLPAVRGMHPAVAHALTRFNTQRNIREIVSETGLSHRHFIKVFSNTVGLTPKRYRDVKRFNQVLNLQNNSPSLSWTEIAADAGFADQAHLVRDFVTHAGITPTEYRKLARNSSHHLSI